MPLEEAGTLPISVGTGNNAFDGDSSNDTLIDDAGSGRLFGNNDADICLGGRGGSISRKDSGDVFDADIETTNETFATVLPLESGRNQRGRAPHSNSEYSLSQPFADSLEVGRITPD